MEVSSSINLGGNFESMIKMAQNGMKTFRKEIEAARIRLENLEKQKLTNKKIKLEKEMVEKVSKTQDLKVMAERAQVMKARQEIEQRIGDIKAKISSTDAMMGLNMFVREARKKAVVLTVTANINKELLKLKGKQFAMTALDKVSPILNKINSYLRKPYYYTLALKDMASEKLGSLLKRFSGTKSFVINTIARTQMAMSKLREVWKNGQNIANKVFKPVVAVKDMATGALSKIGSGISGLINKATSLQGILLTLGAGVGGKFLFDKTLGANATFEQQTISMKHWLGGSESKTQEMMGWLEKNAAQTPFEMSDLMPAASRAVGIADGDLAKSQRLIKLAEDMAALTPGKSVQDAMEALADARMGEFERMKEFNMKFSMEELQKGGFGGFLSQAEGKFAGGAQQLSQSAQGLMSTISDNIWTSLRKMSAGAFEMLKPELQKLVSWFDNNQDTIKQWVDTGSKAMSGFVRGAMWLVGTIAANWPMISSVISQVGAFIQPILGQLLSLFMMIASWVVANMPTFQAAVAEVMSVISPAIQTVIDVLGILWNAWTKAWPTIANILQIAWSVIKPAISLIINIIGVLGEVFKQVFPYILEIVDGVWGFLEPIFGKIGKAIGWISDRVGDLKTWLGGSKKADVSIGYKTGSIPSAPKGQDKAINLKYNLDKVPKIPDIPDKSIDIDYNMPGMPDIPKIPDQAVSIDYRIPDVPELPQPKVDTGAIDKAAGAFDTLKSAASGSAKFISDHDAAFKAIGITLTTIFLPGIISAVTQLGALTAAFVTNTASLIAHTIASNAETLALQAMYMWDGMVAAAQWLYNNSIFAGLGALISYGIQMAIVSAQLLWMKVQQVAVAVAQGAWNAIVGIATALQWLWNVAMTANPIGLIIVGIGALIAIVVLLIKHWDDVKAAALAFWDAIVKTFSNVGAWFKSHVIDPLLSIVPGWLKKFFGGGSVSVSATNNTAVLSSGPDVDGSHASGLSYVPFDNYVANLHKGERVLTAADNREYNKRNQPQAPQESKTIKQGGDTYIFNINGSNKNARELVEEMFAIIKEAKNTMGEAVT